MSRVRMTNIGTSLSVCSSERLGSDARSTDMKSLTSEADLALHVFPTCVLHRQKNQLD